MNMATNIHTVGTPPDGLSEERRQGNMVRMQMEALSRSHRERITTNDTRERKAEFVPLGLIQRRVYQEGTEENSAAQGKARTQLAAWSTAWKNLQDDDTETRSLKEINEGEPTSCTVLMILVVSGGPSTFLCLLILRIPHLLRSQFIMPPC